MTDKDKSPKKQSLLLKPITMPIAIVLSVTGFLLVSIIVSTLIDWTGMLLDWWNDDHQMQVLKNDIAYLGENFTTSIAGVPPDVVASRIVLFIQDYLSFKPNVNPNQPNIFVVWNKFLLLIQPYWQSLIYSSMICAVRIFIIILSIAFYAIVFIVALIDGLVERELRKEGGGLEHAQVYHHAKVWIGRVLIISPMIYLAWPNSINPNWIVLPSATFFFLSVFITFATFKKFL